MTKKTFNVLWTSILVWTFVIGFGSTRAAAQNTEKKFASFQYPPNGNEFLKTIMPFGTKIVGKMKFKEMDIGKVSLATLDANSKEVSVSVTTDKSSKQVTTISILFDNPESKGASKFFSLVMDLLVEHSGVDWTVVYKDVVQKNYLKGSKGFKPMKEGMIISQVPHTISLSGVDGPKSFTITFNRNKVSISSTEEH